MISRVISYRVREEGVDGDERTREKEHIVLLITTKRAEDYIHYSTSALKLISVRHTCIKELTISRKHLYSLIWRSRHT